MIELAIWLSEFRMVQSFFRQFNVASKEYLQATARGLFESYLLDIEDELYYHASHTTKLKKSLAGLKTGVERLQKTYHRKFSLDWTKYWGELEATFRGKKPGPTMHLEMIKPLHLQYNHIQTLARDDVFHLLVVIQSHKDAFTMESDNMNVLWDEGLLQGQISRISSEIAVLRKTKETTLREKDSLERARGETAREAGAAI